MFVDDVVASDPAELRGEMEAERRRISDRIAGLQRNLDDIVAAAELASTDDEHDPEGMTIAYERAQVTALLRQAEEDLIALDHALERVDKGTVGTCEVCGGPISLDRLLALPGVSSCIRCAG